MKQNRILPALLALAALLPCTLWAQTFRINMEDENSKGPYKFEYSVLTETTCAFTGVYCDDERHGYWSDKGDYIFDENQSMTSLAIPTTVTRTTSKGTFTYTVTKIDCKAFYIPKSVTSLTLPSTLEEIGYFTVVSGGGMKELRIPGNLKSITLPYGYVNSVGENSAGWVGGISGPWETIVFEEGSETVGGVGDCPNLTHMEFPQTYKSFVRCACNPKWNEIEEYRVPEGCEHWEGFAGTSLRKLTLPATLTEEDGLGASCFCDLPNLENIIMYGTKPIHYIYNTYDYWNNPTPHWGYKFFGNQTPPEHLTLWVPADCHAAFARTTGWEDLPRIYEGEPGHATRMLFDGETFEETISGVTYRFTATQTDYTEAGSWRLQCQMTSYVSGDLPAHYVLPERTETPLVRCYYEKGEPVETKYTFDITSYGEDYGDVWPYANVGYTNVTAISIGAHTPTLPAGFLRHFYKVRTVNVFCPKPEPISYVFFSGGYSDAAGDGVKYPSVYNTAYLLPGDGRVKVYAETEGWNQFTHIRGNANTNGEPWEFYDQSSGRAHYAYNRPGGGTGLGNGHSPRTNAAITAAAMADPDDAEETGIETRRRAAEEEAVVADVKLSLPNRINDGAFDEEGNSVNLELTALADSIFYGDETLLKVSLPEATDSIGHLAFAGCKGLRDVGFYCGGQPPLNFTPPAIAADAFRDTPEGLRFWIPAGHLSKVVNHPDYASFNLIGGSLYLWTDFDAQGGYFSMLNDDGVELGYYKKVETETGDKTRSLKAPARSAVVGTAGIYLSYEYELPLNRTSVKGDIVVPAEVLGLPVEGTTMAPFSNNAGLTSITLPETFKSIAPHSFAGCSALSTITVLATEPPAIQANNAFDTQTYSEAVLRVPVGCVAAYREAPYWSWFNRIENVKGSTEEAIPGDLNGDGEVNVGDVTTLVNMILGKTEMVKSADLNDDGEVNVGDVTALVNFILGK